MGVIPHILISSNHSDKNPIHRRCICVDLFCKEVFSIRMSGKESMVTWRISAVHWEKVRCCLVLCIVLYNAGSFFLTVLHL